MEVISSAIIFYSVIESLDAIGESNTKSNVYTSDLSALPGCALIIVLQAMSEYIRISGGIITKSTNESA